VARRGKSSPSPSTLVFQSGTGDLFTLNPTASFIWGLLCEGRPVEAIGRRVAKRYRIPPERALEDVFALLAQARRHGIELTR
jgi:hypothetical protein